MTDDDWICGESIDHDAVTTYEDDESLVWECQRCGAEGWEDKPSPTPTTPNQEQ